MIITVANGKGGVGKSTVAAELVSHLADQGKPVIAMDADRNGSLTKMCGLPRDAEVDAVTADVLTGEASVEEAAIPAPTIPGAHVLAGTHDLNAVTGTVEQIAARIRTAGEGGRNVVIDTRPSLDLLTEAAVHTADVIVIATDCSEAAREQVEEIEAFLAVRDREFDWIVPTKYNRRAALHNEVVDALNSKWPGKVTQPIRNAVAVEDAYVSHKTISRDARWRPVSREYRAACKTITNL